jgi:oligosaccharide repeat unit polymerase
MGRLDYHPDIDVLSEGVKLEAWIWTMYSILIMPFGMIMLNRLFKVKGRKLFDTYLKAPIEIVGSVDRNKMVLVVLTIFAVSVLAYILLNTKNIPLYTLLVEGDSNQANIDRITSRRNFGGIIYIKNLLGLIMIPVVSYYSYILMRKYKGLFYIVIFGINLLVALILVSHDVQKAPIAFFILGFAILEVFIGGGISKKKFLTFVILPVVAILIGYSLTTEHGIADQLFRTNSGFYGRTFLIGYFGFPLSLELFPDIITLETYGVGIPSFIIDKTNMNAIESARLIKMYVHPDTVNAGTGNLYSGFYMGEAWANYGYVGLVIAPLVVGFVVQSVHLFLLKSAKEPWLLAFYVALTVKWVVGSGFVNFLFLKLLIWPLILFAASNFILKRMLKTKRESIIR